MTRTLTAICCLWMALTSCAKVVEKELSKKEEIRKLNLSELKSYIGKTADDVRKTLIDNKYEYWANSFSKTIILPVQSTDALSITLPFRL